MMNKMYQHKIVIDYYDRTKPRIFSFTAVNNLIEDDITVDQITRGIKILKIYICSHMYPHLLLLLIAVLAALKI